jgi:hypothetical protein
VITATDIAMEVETISPEMAEEILVANRHNRNLRSARVAQLVEVMRRGEWILNGETIKIAADGTLLDGQHRLQAVVDSGVPIESLVMRGMPLEAQDTVDTGRRRRLADILAIEGHTDSHALGASLSMLHRFRTGKRIDYSHAGAPSPKQALDLLAREPQIRDSVREARRVTKQISGGPVGVFASLHCLFLEIDEEATQDFFDRLADGVGLAKDDPALHLRNQLIRSRNERTYVQSPSHVAALTIKAFNLRRAGRKIDLLSFKKTEKFPEIERGNAEEDRNGQTRL